ncbi:hypothetical protein CPB83DRAFT_862026 [Crepidotus variabilis]|uniref:Uncharacterized protein n=1 Tax=Crepidotus variabilis TaxID=179855 RepID=A0A9P6E7S6_9AGAR|nr:hypothetical protein CPB83DRAFT_862026 [Crepidotus variabilis]
MRRVITGERPFLNLLALPIFILWTYAPNRLIARSMSHDDLCHHEDSPPRQQKTPSSMVTDKFGESNDIKQELVAGQTALRFMCYMPHLGSSISNKNVKVSAQIIGFGPSKLVF